ncbi:MAG: outer membrane protein transport protein [Myxococcales bacterium]|nr:outer membrane protein transport protein [Myxococcales bacterium]
MQGPQETLAIRVASRLSGRSPAGAQALGGGATEEERRSLPQGSGRRGIRRLTTLGVALGASLVASSAFATSALEVPDNGTQQMARGGAWVARASNSLATYYNPAALSGLQSGALLGTNLVFNKECFTRLDTDGQPARPNVPGVTYQEVCNENSGTPNPIPHLAGNLRLSDSLGIGLAFLPPSSLGKITFPEVSDAKAGNTTVQFASPQRYMILEVDGVLLNPTLSVGYAVSDQIRLGLGFVAGFGNLKLSNAAMAQPSANDTRDNVSGDVKAEVDVTDLFIPGFVFGALYSATDQIDIGFALHWQDAFKGKGDITATSGYWGANGRLSPDGGTASKSQDAGEDLVSLEIPNPLQVRLGVAFRQPRDGAPGYLAEAAERDPLSQDVFDIELDLEYTKNSDFDAIKVRVPKDTVLIYSGTASVGAVPENSDIALNMKDTFGVRLGGDFVAVPDMLAVRAGMWFQTAAADSEYLHPSPVGGARFGLSGGGQFRIAPVDIELGYMLVSLQEMDNKGKGSITAISGNQGLGSRSPYAVNGGKISGTAHIISAGVGAKF